MVKVGVVGAAGKMGSMACRSISETDDLELVAEVDADDSIEDLAAYGADVAVDFTHPGAVMDNIAWCIGHGVSVVAGTSGFTEERLEVIRRQLAAGPVGVGVLVVPNFSIGAVLLMRFAVEAARYFESAEIVELHHPTKRDAPSGTAMRTAQLMGAARGAAGLQHMPDATVEDQLGTRGGQVAGIPVHSVRVRGLVAHQEVVLGNVGETLTIRHDMPDRAAAMAGMLASVHAVGSTPGLTVGLEHVLGRP